MRRHSAAAALGAVALGAAIALAPTAASAGVQKFTFNDVMLPDGQIGEITASIKDLKKDDSIYCGYFSDDFVESLGYYFAHVDYLPENGDELLAACLANFDNREI